MSAAGRASIARTLAIVGIAALAGTLALTAYTTLRIWQRGEVDEAPRIASARAIVVLGAAQYDGRPSPVFQARLDHAIDLWREGRAPILVMTGGGLVGDRTTEADTGRDYAVAQGVPTEEILMENRGRSTLESLQAIAPILAARGGGPILFVSDPTHLLRVVRMARDLGIDAHASPAANSPSDATLERRIEATVHELGALAWYGISGRPVAEGPTSTATP